MRLLHVVIGREHGNKRKLSVMHTVNITRRQQLLAILRQK